MYVENDSLGEWFKKATADDRKTTLSGIVERRSGNCKLQQRRRPFKNE